MLGKFLIGNKGDERLDDAINCLLLKIGDREAIFSDFPWYSNFVYKDAKSNQTITPILPKNKKVVFIVAHPTNNISDKWISAYSSPDLAIWESRERSREVLPLRHGLSDGERQSALKIARQAIAFYLTANTVMDLAKLKDDVPERFHLKSDLGLAVWREGKLRGSCIVQNSGFIEGILEASALVCQDKRFKPLTIGELDETLIEISIISDIKVTLSKENLYEQTIDPEKGYFIGKKDKSAWFLPEIFNVRNFANISEFIAELAAKARIEKLILTDPELRIKNFEVYGFVDNPAQDNSLVLRGPMLEIKELDKGEILARTDLATNWLLKMQEPEGNYLPLLNLIGLDSIQIDWPRSILTGWSMLEWGKKISNFRYIESATKNFHYFYDLLIEKKMAREDDLLNLSYLGQIALSLDDAEKADRCAKTILSLYQPGSELRPLEYQQMSSFFSRLSWIEPTYFTEAEKLAKKARDFSEKTEKNNLFFAEQAELVNSYVNLHLLTGEKDYLDFAKKVAGWLIQNQLPNGSFPLSPSDPRAHTSMTSKNIEVLAALVAIPEITMQERNYYKRSMKKGLDWLFSFQINKDNSFAIDPEKRKLAQDSIRAGDLGLYSRIDSVSHLLLALSRLNLEKDLEANENVSTLFPLAGPERIFFDQKEIVPDKPFFLGQASMRWEKIMHELLWKLMIKIGLLQYCELENILGHQNSYLRNCGYLLEYLTQKKVIEKKDVRSLLTYLEFKDTPGFFEARLFSPSRGKGGLCFSRGFSSNWKKCLGQVLGEILERHFHDFRNIEKSSLIKDSCKQLKEKGIHFISPEKLSHFSPEQIGAYPQRSWDNDSIFNWEKCFDLSDGQPVYIPAQLVYVYYNPAKKESILGESNTSGLGAFFTKEKAILSGLYEIIQRDAFFCHWLNKIPAKKIDLDKIEDWEFRKIYSQSQKHRFIVKSFSLKSETGLPVIITVIHGRNNEEPCYSLGAGCDPNAVKSLIRSWEEAWSIYYWSRYKFQGEYKKLPTNYKPFITPITIDDRISLWSNCEMKGRLDFLEGSEITLEETQNNYPPSFGNEKEELNFIVNKFKKMGAGHEIYVHLSEDKILQKTNFFSARVIVPSMIPMYYNEENAPTKHDKIKKESINVTPHLFP